jgi:hypothetical protein
MPCQLQLSIVNSSCLMIYENVKRETICAMRHYVSYSEPKWANQSESYLPKRRLETRQQAKARRVGILRRLPPLKRQVPVAFVYLTGYKSRSLSPSRVFTIVQR